MRLIQHMSKTLDDFRNFFRPDKERTEFKVCQVVYNAIQLVRASFDSNHIMILVDCRKDPIIHGYPNEYTQVILKQLAIGY